MANEKISEYTNVITVLQDNDLFDTSENQGGPPWESSSVAWSVIRAQVDNLYNVDGTLDSNRTVNQDSNSLQFNNVAGFGVGGAPVASSVFSVSATGNANAIVVEDSSGDVILGGSSAIANFSVDVRGNLVVSDSGAVTPSSAPVFIETNSNRGLAVGHDGGIERINIHIDSVSQTVNYDSVNTPHIFEIDGTEHVRITESSNNARVGIGNPGAAPGATVHIQGEGTGATLGLIVEDSGGVDNFTVIDEGICVFRAFTVATLPTATAGGMIRVSDETGGDTLAYSDGVNWRRMSDGAIVS